MSEQTKNIPTKETLGSIKSFHRHYTNLINIMTRDFDDSEISVSEVRVLHEIEKEKDCTCKLLAEKLMIDSGYMSRILAHLEELELIARHPSPTDRRSMHISLTPKGRQKLTESNEHFDDKIQQIISDLPHEQQQKLVDNILSMERILNDWNSYMLLG